MSPPSGVRVSAVICRRELIRFVRIPSRIVAAVGTPGLLWFFISSGVGESFRPPGETEATYAAFLLPGIMTLIAVFSSVFSSISIIEDRREGWLQSVLVSPAPRWSIALGKIVGGAAVSWAQSAILLPLVLVTGASIDAAGALEILLALALTSFAMTGLGLAFAWRTETSAAFHAIMNLVFLPMWLLSGAFFPPAGAATWLGWVMRVNPLTWCTEAIRGPILGEAVPWTLPAAGAFAAAMLVLATVIIARQGSRD